MVSRLGGFSTMRKVVREVPPPASGNVIVKVDFSSIAGRDIAIAQAWFLEDKDPTLVPLSEGFGTVVAVAPDERRIKVGDKVTCAHFALWEEGPWTPANYAVDIGNTVDGWLTQYAVLPSSGIAVLPDGMDGATRERLADRSLDQVVRLHIHRGRRLIEEQDLHGDVT